MDELMYGLVDRLTAVLPADYQATIWSAQKASELRPRFGIGFQQIGTEHRAAWMITVSKGDTIDMHWQRLGPAVAAALKNTASRPA
jgi:hypothetical protein